MMDQEKEGAVEMVGHQGQDDRESKYSPLVDQEQEWIQARKRKYEENSSEEDRQRRAGRRGMTEEEIDEMLLHVGGVDAS